MARAAAQLRSVSPELFAHRYPESEAKFRHPSLLRRLIWWVNAKLFLRSLDFFDKQLQLPLPAKAYEHALYYAIDSEMMRIWRRIVTEYQVDTTGIGTKESVSLSQSNGIETNFK